MQYEFNKREEAKSKQSFQQQAYTDANQWRSFIDDGNHNNIMFISTVTGEIRTGVPTALQWVRHIK